MKRMHISVSVEDLQQSTTFYTTLFGQQPVLLKEDYARWMLEDPAVNFTLSASSLERGQESAIDHIGIQCDTLPELDAMRVRLKDMESSSSVDQEGVECCYSQSSKTWIRDPDGVVWETFVTHGNIEHYGDGRERRGAAHTSQSNRCCSSESAADCCN